MKFDVTHLGIRVIINPSMSGISSLIRPHGVEGTVLFIQDDPEDYELVRDMINMGMVAEIACAPNIRIRALVKVRWDNNQCAWHTQGTLSYRYSKGLRCNRIWFDHSLRLSVNNTPIGMLTSIINKKKSQVFKVKWIDANEHMKVLQKELKHKLKERIKYKNHCYKYSYDMSTNLTVKPYVTRLRALKETT